MTYAPFRPTPDRRAPADRGPQRSWLLFPFVLVAVLGALLIALTGAWIGTTLAVYAGGPVWLAVVGAIGCFLVLPFLWELVADRRQRRGRLRDTILRSAFLSLTFVIVLLATHPQMAFKALATRGDWVLGGSHSALAETMRGVFHTTADGLEWLYHAAHRTAFRAAPDVNGNPTPADDDALIVDPNPTPAPSPSSPSRPAHGESPEGSRVAFPIPESALTWPLPATLHPAVLSLSAEAKTSIASVAHAIAARVRDPFERVKALHDFVATWVAYDAVAFADDHYGPQDAETVFRQRRGVCAGYANLMVALGKASGDHIVFIGGDARLASAYEAAPDGAEAPTSKAGHAWNAVQIGKRWYLLDTTWDAGTVDGRTYTPRYSTTYLFIPPELMVGSHLPEAARWQLLTTPLSRGEWLRQPLVRPLAAEYGLTFVAPTTPMVSASKTLDVVVDNPRRNWLCGTPCLSVNDARAVLTFTLAADQRQVVRVFAGPAQYGTFQDVFEVVVDP